MVVILDSQQLQVLAEARSAFVQLGMVCQLQLSVSQLDPATMAHTIVTSRLDYFNMLYMGLPLKRVWK